MGSRLRLILGSALFIIFVAIAGCAASQIKPVQATPALPPLFPPQAVMQTGDYESFFTENSEVLKSCNDPDKCALALFNLSFLYCYSKSPYYDPQKGLKHIDDLIAAVPGSQWTDQARVWKDIIEKDMQKRPRKRQASREDARAKEAATESQEQPDESGSSAEVYQGKDWEVDRQRMEDEMASKDEVIKKLRKQLERSRQIDIEMEEKERGLRQ
jgi:hypothetical protein